MSSQLLMPLGTKHPDGFVRSEANENACNYIEKTDGLIVNGPAGSGKTQIALEYAKLWDGIYFSSKTDAEIYLSQGNPSAVFVDMIDQWPVKEIAQQELFHLFNFQRQHKAKLILFARLPVSHWKINLPDLATRLETLPVAEIQPPDDSLIVQLLSKQLSARGILVKNDVITYISKRLAREYSIILDFVDALDTLSARRKVNVTRGLAKEILEGFK